MAMRYCKDCQLYECCMRTPLGGCQDLDNVAPKPAEPITTEEVWKNLFEQVGCDWDWEKFRREAAKDILATLIASPGLVVGNEPVKTIGDHVRCSIGIADELVRKLKETEQSNN